MKSGTLWFAVFVLVSLVSAAAQEPLSAPPSAQNGEVRGEQVRQEVRALANKNNSFGRLPLSFEQNDGQAEKNVRFLARTGAGTLFLTKSRVTFELRAADAGGARRATVQLTFPGSNSNPEVIGFDSQPGRTNYFSGSDSSKWLTDIPNYARVKYKHLYKGVDLVFYGNGRQLEYDLELAPGVDPRTVRLRFQGIQGLHVDHGELLVETEAGALRQHRPRVYQHNGSGDHEVVAKYVMVGHRTVGFEVAPYDSRKPLIIDPILSYSTFVGALSFASANAILVDSDGQAIITGSAGPGFPTTRAFQSTGSGVYLAKLNATGTQLLWATYLGQGGTAYALASDSAGNIYVAGTTVSGFPTTNSTAFQPTPPGSNPGFLAKLTPRGNSLLYSTYLGGCCSDTVNAIALDSSDNVYLAGTTSSTNFPVTSSAFQSSYGGGSQNAFVSRLDPSKTGSAGLVYSTFMGGTGADVAKAVGLDEFGFVYVAGYTSSTNFPVSPGALRTSLGTASQNAFVAKLNTSASGSGSRIYATYLGGSTQDAAFAMKVSKLGNPYIAGYTGSADFPATTGAYQTLLKGSQNVFVTQLNSLGTAPVWSTFLGGSYDDSAYGMLLDSSANVYLVGATSSTDFPLMGAPLDVPPVGFSSPFFTEMNSSGTHLVLSLVLGSSGVTGCNSFCFSQGDSGNALALDSAGGVFLAGTAISPNFPVTVGVIQTAPLPDPNLIYPVGPDAFVSKIVNSSDCTISINPAIINLSDAGATSGSTAVQAATGCGWHTVSNNSDWITLTNGPYGLNNGSVGLSFSQNVGQSARTGTVTISSTNSVTLTVNQPGFTCTYSIAPMSSGYKAQGGTGSISVAAPPSCGWTAGSAVPWVTISPPGSGSGNGTVDYTVALNKAAGRSTMLLVAGSVFTVTQQSADFESLTLAPTTVTGGTSSTGTVTLRRPAPTGGITVHLASNNTSVATVPASVMVPAGQTTTTFTVTTMAVTAAASVKISGAYASVDKSATLTVNP